MPRIPVSAPASLRGPRTQASHADSAAGQADSPASYGDSAAGQADSPASYGAHGGHSADQGAHSADQAGSSADQGAYSAEYAGSSADQGAYSAEYADSATHAADSGQADEAGAAWPHQSFLELGALPTAAPCARLHATLVLLEWDLGTLVRTAGLVVSELVSNAVQASTGLTGSRFAGYWAPGIPPVRMWLSADDHRVVIQVWDGSDRPPVPQPVEPEADSGRGLLLIGALSAEWGCYTPEKSSGKVVWAVVTG